MKVVIVEEGVRTELEFTGSKVQVGRSVDNDIRIQGPKVSRHHCRIETGPSGTFVHDLGSSNGTLVNGERVDQRQIGPRDELQVGAALLRIETPAREVEPNGAEPGALPEAAAGELGLATLTGERLRERENLCVFARVTRELLRERDIKKLLRLIVDSAIQLSGAERGFLILAENGERRSAPHPGGLGVAEMKVRIARSFDQADIPVPASRLSMGIAGRVFQEGQAVLSVDAGRDARFDGMASVEGLRLRSVMCLPIFAAGPEEGVVDGVLFVDNRLQEGAFGEQDLDLVRLFADQASLAIANARQLAELVDRSRRLEQQATKIELLNEQLGRKVRDRDTELSVVRRELGRERGRYDYTSIVGASEGMRRVFRQLDRIIESELPVLVHGESGTGKELIARAIHFNGPRKERPFVSENCAALPDTLLESELFGHARGAFTGAHKSKKGLLEQADGGTLFLDEIGDMSPEMQKKLLRVLQEGEFRSLGSDRRIHVDVRVIAASHHDLDALVGEGKFREDLFYRVNVLRVDLPPLRERREDVPLLAEALLARAAREAGRTVPFLPHEVMAALVAHEWPGNVRELENEMRRLVVMASEAVTLEHLSTSVVERRGPGGAASVGVPGALAEGASIRDAVAELEQRSIEAALEAAGGNKSQAAKSLGISRFALQRKLDKYGLKKNGKPAGGSGES